MSKKFSRAKTLKGLWGNYKFLWRDKTWATIMVFAKGILIGALVMFFTMSL